VSIVVLNGFFEFLKFNDVFGLDFFRLCSIVINELSSALVFEIVVSAAGLLIGWDCNDL